MILDAYLFDLDGTLLNTLPDLVRLTNIVLAEREWPERSRDEILSFVGHGGRHLLKCAAPKGTSDVVLNEVFARWRELFPTYGHMLTKPYDGIPEVIAKLKTRRAKLGVLSNKFNAAVQVVIEEHFPGMFDLVCGECEDIPRKPDPAGLSYMMRVLGVSSAHVAYIGDSASDMEVARRADAVPIGVTWGYQSASALMSANAEVLIDYPRELLTL